MSKRTAAALIAAATAGASVAVVARRRSTDAAGSPDSNESRWRVVTIARPEAEVIVDGALPAPLIELADLIDVRTSAAPGDRGTELAARIRPNSAAGDHGDRVGQLRAALRRSKQLLETGEVATNEPQPEGHRPTTPAGLLVDALSRRSPEKGIL